MATFSKDLKMTAVSTILFYLNMCIEKISLKHKYGFGCHFNHHYHLVIYIIIKINYMIITPVRTGY